MKNYELDPNSDHYRICPECGEELMVNHGNRDYCDNKCGNYFNNRKKKLKKLCEPSLIPKNVPEIKPTEKLLVGLERNLNTLWGCHIPPEGKRVAMQHLDDKAFDFKAYTSKIVSTDRRVGNKVEYGPFIMSWEDQDYVFVQLKNK
jgi:ribosomal protein S27AE